MLVLTDGGYLIAGHGGFGEKDGMVSLIDCKSGDIVQSHTLNKDRLTVFLPHKQKEAVLLFGTLIGNIFSTSATDTKK